MDHIMDNMMRSMMMPFGDLSGMGGYDPFAPLNSVMGMLEANNQMMNGGGLQLMQAQRGGNQSQFMQPANLFGQTMFAGFPGMSGGIVHSSFSSTSYTTDEHGRRQVYQESHASTQGPGGIKETKSSVRDSRTGHQEMSIGHHIADKAHIKKKSKNAYTGDEEQVVDCINLDDAEVDQFEQEWQTKAGSCYGGSTNKNRSMMLKNQGAPARLALASSAGEDRPQHRDNAYVNQVTPSSSGVRSKSRSHKNSRTSHDLSPMHSTSSTTGSTEGKISKKIKDIKNKLISKKSQSSKDHQ